MAHEEERGRLVVEIPDALDLIISDAARIGENARRLRAKVASDHRPRIAPDSPTKRSPDEPPLVERIAVALYLAAPPLGVNLPWHQLDDAARKLYWRQAAVVIAQLHAWAQEHSP